MFSSPLEVHVQALVLLNTLFIYCKQSLEFLKFPPTLTFKLALFASLFLDQPYQILRSGLDPLELLKCFPLV